MTFIKEITPHIERIRLHKEGGRITSIEILREIRDIHFTHIRSNDFDIPTNLGCGSCVLVKYLDQSCEYIGIEANTKFVSYAQEKNLNVIRGDIFEVDFPKARTSTRLP